MHTSGNYRQLGLIRGLLDTARRKLKPLLLSVLVALSLGVGCHDDRFAGDGTDGSGNMTMPPPPLGSSCNTDRECKAGRRCVAMRCVMDYGDCATDNDCQDDTYCGCPPEAPTERCACLPWSPTLPPKGTFDPTCRGAAFKPEQFENPVVKCQWPPVGEAPAYKNVLSSPLVVDLDGDGSPEIVFSAGYFTTGHLIALSGKDCSVKWDRPVNTSGCTHIAAADLDNDGKLEIVGFAPNLTVFDYQGNVLVSSGELGTALCARDYPPALANLDGAGPPEIVVGAAVFRYTPKPAPSLSRLWNYNLMEQGSWASIAVAQDLDGDGKMEVIAGNKVFDGITGADKTKPSMKDLGGGYPAIGDFNADGKPDIVLVSSKDMDQKVSVIDYVNDRLIMPPTAASMGWGGPPTVADFDGDGKPDFATASAHYYYVYSPQCLQSPVPARCKGVEDGVLWQSPTLDDSSGSTGSSVFDFNGDGVAEVVYRDECWLRVYDGRDGKKLFVAPVTSGTVVELPVIADTDADGHSEIVVSADAAQGDKCKTSPFATELGVKHTGQAFGVRVYMDPKNRWMPSRPLWNQHSYHITNINDDGTVPLSEAPNYKTYNNYRMNVQGSGGSKDSRPDATSRIQLPPDVGDCVKLFRLGGVVCNRGASALAPGFPASFYQGDPRRPGARLICSGKTLKGVSPGECQPVSCDWNSPPPGPYDLWLRADDDGKGTRSMTQCKDGNDLAHLGLTTCTTNPGFANDGAIDSYRGVRK